LRRRHLIRYFLRFRFSAPSSFRFAMPLPRRLYAMPDAAACAALLMRECHAAAPRCPPPRFRRRHAATLLPFRAERHFFFAAFCLPVCHSQLLRHADAATRAMPLR